MTVYHTCCVYIFLWFSNVTRFQGIDHGQTDLAGMTCFWVTEVILDIMSYTAYDEERREIHLRRVLQSFLATYVVFVLSSAIH